MSTDPDMYVPDPHGWHGTPKPWRPGVDSEQPDGEPATHKQQEVPDDA
jgi:hypothetical protein